MSSPKIDISEIQSAISRFHETKLELNEVWIELMEPYRARFFGSELQQSDVMERRKYVDWQRQNPPQLAAISEKGNMVEALVREFPYKSKTCGNGCIS